MPLFSYDRVISVIILNKNWKETEERASLESVTSRGELRRNTAAIKNSASTVRI